MRYTSPNSSGSNCNVFILSCYGNNKILLSFSLNSTSVKSKKRKSLVISNPIPCNTAFPADHVSIHSSTENAKDAVPFSPTKQTQSISEETSLPEESAVPSKDVNSSDSDLSSSGTNTPRESVCDNGGSDSGSRSQSPEEAEVEADAEAVVELATNQPDNCAEEELKSEAASREVSNPSDSVDGDAPQSPEQENVSEPPPEEKEAKPKSGPVPAPRISFRSTDSRPLLTPRKSEETEEAAVSQEAADSGDESGSDNLPGFLYKVHATIQYLEREIITLMRKLFKCTKSEPNTGKRSLRCITLEETFRKLLLLKVL